MMKYRLWLCVALIMWTSGMAEAQKKMVFTPQWVPQAQFVGFYVASSMGFYQEAGLDVTIKHPSASKPNVEYLVEGESQFITLNLVTAMMHISNGIPLVNVMQVSQQNNLLIVSHTPLKGPESLRGKKVGHWRSGHSELPMAMDRKYGLGIQWVPFVSNINLYISGAIDAATAMSYNELFQLKMAGQRISDDQLLYMRDIGYNIPEDGVYVTLDFYRKHKEQVKRFVEATRRGWEWAVAHPEEALDIVMVTMQQTVGGGNLIAQQWMLNEILQQLADKDTGKRSYKLDPKSLQLANSIMLGTGILKKEITYKRMTQL